VEGCPKVAIDRDRGEAGLRNLEGRFLIRSFQLLPVGAGRQIPEELIDPLNKWQARIVLVVVRSREVRQTTRQIREVLASFEESDGIGGDLIVHLHLGDAPSLLD
jgi:hypothetical protein